METGIKIGGQDRGTVEAVAEAIVKILETGYDSHAEQETIQYALGTLSELVEVKNVSLSHCHIGS